MEKRIGTRWFRERLADRGMNQSDLARHLNMNRSNVSKILTGQIGFDPETAVDIAIALRVDLEQVLSHAGITMPRHREPASVKVAGLADARGAVKASRDAPKRVAPPGGDPGKLEAVLVAAAGTPADGWACYFSPTARIEPDAAERLALVETVDGMLKRSLLERGRWDVVPLFDGSAKAAIAGALLRSAAPILWVRT